MKKEPKYVVITCEKCKRIHKVKNDINKPTKCICGSSLFLGAYKIGTLSEGTNPNL